MKSPLRKLRELFELTQQEIADAVGLAQSTYARIENEPDYQTRKQDAAALSAYWGGGIDELAILFPGRFPNYLAPQGREIK